MEIGDRVIRKIKMYPDDDKKGWVTDKYNSIPDLTGNFLTMYAVQWDCSDYEERGYLEVGLEKIDAEVSEKGN